MFNLLPLLVVFTVLQTRIKLIFCRSIDMRVRVLELHLAVVADVTLQRFSKTHTNVHLLLTL